MNKLKILWPYLLILVVVALFFFPIFKGLMPFPGDLLVNENPYKTQGFLGYSPGGYPNKAQDKDVITEMYPWRNFSINQLKKGSIPFWDPNNFSGNPQMADFQTAVFYPFNILYFVFSFNSAWTLIIILQTLLAAVFMYIFLHKALYLKKFASVIGAVAFGFSSYMVVWLEYGNIGSTLLWLPIALFFTRRIYQKTTAVNFLLLIVSLSLSILAGYIQGVFYIYVVCFLYFFFLFLSDKKRKENLKKIPPFLAALLFPVLLTLFQILPTYELFLNSTRGSYSLPQISTLLSPLYYWVTVLVPDFFGNPATRNYWFNGTYIERVMYAGVAILFFAIYGAVHSKNKEKKFFLLLSVLSLIVATDFPGIKFLYLIPIPAVSTTVPTREFNIFIFGLIILSAMGLDHWLSEKSYKTKLTIIFGLTYVFIWGLVFLLPRFLNISPADISVTKHNLVLPTILAFATIAAFYVKKINVRLSLLAVTLIVCFDLFYFFNKITPFSPIELVYPKSPVISFLQKNAGINRFWGYGSAYILPNFQLVDKTYSPEGNDALHIEPYGNLLASSINGKIPGVLPRMEANVAPGYGTNDLSNNFYRQRVLNLLGVKYVLNQDTGLLPGFSPDNATFPSDTYKLIWQNSPWQVYENKQALPRFFMASDYLVENHSQILSSVYNKNINLRKTILLEEKPISKIDKNTKGAVKLISYSPNTVKFQAVSTGNTILFLSDNYYPGWQAFVDGKETKIYRADYTFRAIILPKGLHDIVFSYYPASFVLGIKIFFAALALLILSVLGIKKYEKKN